MATHAVSHRAIAEVPDVPFDPDWVEEVFEQVERLVAEGDETFLADRIAALVKSQPGPVPVKASRLSI